MRVDRNNIVAGSVVFSKVNTVTVNFTILANCPMQIYFSCGLTPKQQKNDLINEEVHNFIRSQQSTSKLKKKIVIPLNLLTSSPDEHPCPFHLYESSLSRDSSMLAPVWNRLYIYGWKHVASPSPPRGFTVSEQTPEVSKGKWTCHGKTRYASIRITTITNQRRQLIFRRLKLECLCRMVFSAASLRIQMDFDFCLTLLENSVCEKHQPVTRITIQEIKVQN